MFTLFETRSSGFSLKLCYRWNMLQVQDEAHNEILIAKEMRLNCKRSDCKYCKSVNICTFVAISIFIYLSIHLYINKFIYLFLYWNL